MLIRVFKYCIILFNFKIVYQDKSSTITISDGLRKDTGMYKLRVENENGSDEAEAELVVLSPSAKPMGPLECEDILGTVSYQIGGFPTKQKPK